MDFFETEWERPEFDSVPSLAQNMVYLLRDCDDILVRKTLQTTYRDFCKRSAALRTWRKVCVADKKTRYVVAPVLSGEVDCVTQVLRYGQFPLKQGRDWWAIGDPPILHIPWARHVIVPDTAVEDVPPDFVMVEAVEVPYLNEERAPRPFLRRYGDALVDGALARLFSMSNRAWSDPVQAQEHGIAYSNALSEARHRCMNGGPAVNAGGGFAVDMGGIV